MKCSACANNECEGKYENRHRCRGDKEGIDCSCYCHRTKTGVFFSSLLSIGTGVAATAAGIGLTVATGGVAAVVAGAAIVGGGTSLVISPFQKLVTKECVTLTDSAKEVALSATIGAVTGPIGALGSTASKGATVAVRIGARIAAGSAAGATSGAICEGAKLVKGEEVSWESLGKSVAIGAVAGTVGGASTSIAHSSACKPIADVIGIPTLRIITQAGTSMATDAGVQLATTGEIDPKLLLANTTGQVVCGVTAEAASSIAASTKRDQQRSKELKKFADDIRKFYEEKDHIDRNGKYDANKPENRPDHKPDRFDIYDKKPFRDVLDEKPNLDSEPKYSKSHQMGEQFEIPKTGKGKKFYSNFDRKYPKKFEKFPTNRPDHKPDRFDIYDKKPFRDVLGEKPNLDSEPKYSKSHQMGEQFEIQKTVKVKRLYSNSESKYPRKFEKFPTNRLSSKNQFKNGFGTRNNLRPEQFNFLFKPNMSKENKEKQNERESSADSKIFPERLQSLVDLLDSQKTLTKSIINRESVARALEILRNTIDPELYAILLQYNIPLDTIGIEATRLMLEQIFEVKIRIEVTFNERLYIFGKRNDENTKVIQLDLVNGHFINELQDGASALYNDCFYYAIVEQFPDILILTPNEMRRNIADVIKTNEYIRSLIMNRDHAFFIDIGFFGGRDAKRELEEARRDREAFLKRILELLTNPMGRDHSYNVIDRDFPGRFDVLYDVPLEIDHVPPVSVWINIFISLQKMIKAGLPHQRLLKMFQTLTGLEDPTELSIDSLRKRLKKLFPCIILTGLVHRNLLTTYYSFTTMAFCSLLINCIENDKFEEALEMIFQDHHNTTIFVRDEFTRIIFPQTLSEELDILHAWQRSICDFFLRVGVIDEPQANYLFDVIDNFPIEDYDHSFRLSWERFMNLSDMYEKMYKKRGLLLSDHEYYLNTKLKKKKDEEKEK